MRIGDLYGDDQTTISIEVFPPKTPKGDDALFKSLDCLSKYKPGFVSCTYGAGGSTSKRTVELCSAIQQKYNLTATAHFTCVGSTRDELVEWLNFAHEQGLGNIMALRGDPPEGQDAFQAVDGGLLHANELVTLIRETIPEMGIGVAGYPEKHPEAASLDVDLQNLKRKVDSGADAVFTQLFYDNSAFLDFREKCEQAGITIPIVPGIMPITEFARIKRITSMCGATIPEKLANDLEQVQDDKQAQFEIGVEHALGQCRELIEANVAGIHFYVLNRSKACERILNALDLQPATKMPGE